MTQRYPAAAIGSTPIDFTDEDLTGADLSGRDLRGCNFTRANLTDADLRYSDVRSADFKDADLTRAQTSLWVAHAKRDTSPALQSGNRWTGIHAVLDALNGGGGVEPLLRALRELNDEEEAVVLVPLMESFRGKFPAAEKMIEIRLRQLEPSYIALFGKEVKGDDYEGSRAMFDELADSPGRPADPSPHAPLRLNSEVPYGNYPADVAAACDVVERLRPAASRSWVEKAFAAGLSLMRSLVAEDVTSSSPTQKASAPEEVDSAAANRAVAIEYIKKSPPSPARDASIKRLELDGRSGTDRALLLDQALDAAGEEVQKCRRRIERAGGC